MDADRLGSMKADPTELTTLLDLQGLDTAIEQVKRKAQSLPIHQTIANLKQRYADASDELIEARTAASDAEVVAERAEADVIPVRERLTRNQARVDAGEMDAKALSSALDEIEHLKQRISDLEDAELEAMDALERAQSHVGELTDTVSGIEKELRAEMSARDAEIAELAVESKSLTEARADMAESVPAPLLALYEKVRARSNGVGVAKLQGHRCSGCGLEATVADYTGYMSAPSDEVIRCAECDRILVR